MTLAVEAPPLSQQEPRFGLLWLPALGVPARHYARFGDALGALGVALETVEWRGTGTSPLRAGRHQDWGYRELLLDAAQALGNAQRAHPQRVWLLGGHSMGGQLAALLAAMISAGEFAGAAPPQGLALVATGVPHWRLFRGRMRWGFRAFLSVLPVLTAMLGYFPGRALRFADREARGVMLDWRHSALAGEYAARGVTLNLERALQSLRTPVCAIAFDRDSLAPVSTMRGLLAKMPLTTTSQTLLGATDLGARADHFGWLKQPDAIAATIASWALSLEAVRNIEG